MTLASAPEILAWLLTYALHSTVLLGAAWFAARSGRLTPMMTDVAWKTALVGGVLTATAQMALDRRPAGTIAFGTPAAVSAPSTLPLPTDLGSSEVATGEAAISSPTNGLAPDVAASIDWTSLVAAFWILAASALVLWYVARRLILVGRLGDRRAVEKGEVTVLLDTLCRESGVKHYVHLTASGAISSPVALGSGEICLPAAALVELEPAQQRAMLAHELAHLVRRDPQWLVASCLVERAFFFQPLNRLARSGVQESAELCADEWAARQTGGVPLARALVKVAEWIQASPLGVPVAGFAEERSQLSRRVSRLLESTAIAAPRSRGGAIAVAAAMLLLTTAFAPGVRRATEVDGSLSASLLGPFSMDAQESQATEVAVDGKALVVDTAIVRAVMLRLKDEDAGVRQAAADALGRLRHPMAIAALIDALADEEHDVQRSALSALSNYERGVPAAPIRKLLAAEDAEMRNSALEILKEMRDRASIPTIAQLVTDPNEDVRHAALHAMDELEAPMGEDLLTRAMDDVSADVRETAAQIAGDRQVVSMVPKLIRMLDDRSSSVRHQVAHALTEMRTEASHAALKKALTHTDPEVRKIAVEYFGEDIDK